MSINISLVQNDAFRFLSKITVSKSGCWDWKGSKNKKGYGAFHVGGSVMLAHRVSYSLFNSNDPLELLTCHTCDNPGCVNPDHLFLGTNQDNMIDMHKKNRGNRPAGNRHYAKTSPLRTTFGKNPLIGEDAFGSKLKAEYVTEIRKLKKSGVSTREICNTYSIHRVTLYDLIHRRTWRHVP